MLYLLQNRTMTYLPFRKDTLSSPQMMIESITLKKILRLCPDAGRYESQIKFTHVNKKAALDLSLLPEELSARILQLLG